MFLALMKLAEFAPLNDTSMPEEEQQRHLCADSDVHIKLRGRLSFKSIAAT